MANSRALRAAQKSFDPRRGGRRFGSDIVALSKAWENVMADTRPFDPALLGDAAKEPQRRS
jgi:hypothetical protein